MSEQQENTASPQQPIVMCELKKKAKEIAVQMKDDCDGSYVGSEMSPMMDILGNRVELFVLAFWEKSFWFEFEATVNGVEYRDSVYT